MRFVIFVIFSSLKKCLKNVQKGVAVELPRLRLIKMSIIITEGEEEEKQMFCQDPAVLLLPV